MCPFSLDDMQYVATTCQFVETPPEVILHKLAFKRENSAYVILSLYSTFSICLHQDTREPNCFKLGMKLDMTELYSMIPV